MSEFRRRLMQSKQQDWTLLNAIGSNGNDYLVLDYKPNINTFLYIDCTIFDAIAMSIPFFDATDWNNATSKTNRCSIIAGGYHDGGIYVAIGNFLGAGAPFVKNVAKRRTFFNISFNIPIVTTELGTTDLSQDLSVTGFTSSDFLHIFKRNDNNNIAPNKCIFIYRISIYENNTLVGEYLPFKDDKGNGLINIMNNTKFYGVKGTKFIEEL